jgi:hypothetical protein
LLARYVTSPLPLHRTQLNHRGKASSYGHYITTIEEYGEQRYEGASTLFGPHTLEGYMDKYTSLVKFLSPNATGTVPSDPAPPEQTSKAISLRVRRSSLSSPPAA